MPISFRPNAKVWIFLESDKDIEESIRPKFRTRAMTCEQVDKWTEDLQSLVASKGTYDDLLALLLTYVDGWQNFPDEFSAEAMRKALTRREIWELALNLPTKIGMGEDQLPLSVLPSPTGGAASADHVQPPVKTSPPNANPS